MNPTQFQPMLSTIVSSQEVEVTLGKQPIMAEYGREVRNALNAFPPEVSRGLMAEYQEPAPAIVAQMEGAILAREHAIENAGQEQTLDQEWLSGGGPGRKIREADAGAEDEWNAPRA